MPSKGEIMSALIRVGDNLVDLEELAEALDAELKKMAESRESKSTRVVRAQETR